MSRRVRAAGAVVTALVLAAASGCSYKGLYSVNLPGGPGGGPGYHVTAIFDNVLDLVPQSAVRVNDVAVGSVEDISLTKGMKARVRMKIKKSVRLPANSVAILEQTTLLGEKFIAIGPPPGQQPQGTLKPGAVLSQDNTTAYPDVEDLFGVLSAVLNGGGIERIQTINVELAKALTGRESSVRDLLKQLDTFVGGLDAQKTEIVRALDKLDALTSKLAAQNGTIATALHDLGPGLKVLADNRAQLTKLLTHLSRLGEVGSRIIEASRADTVASLRDLAPVLTKVADAEQNLPRSLELLLDYPFPKNATNAMPGDYAGLRLTLAADTFFRLVAPPVGPVPAPPGGGGGSPLPGGLPNPLPSLPNPLPSGGATTGGGLGGLLGGALS